jgi:hypothetical protein
VRVYEGGDGAVRCDAPCLVKDVLDANIHMYLSMCIGEGGDGGGCIVTLAARRFTAWFGPVKGRLGVLLEFRIYCLGLGLVTYVPWSGHIKEGEGPVKDPSPRSPQLHRLSLLSLSMCVCVCVCAYVSMYMYMYMYVYK